MGLQFVENVVCGYGRSEIQTENDGLYDCDRNGSLDFGDVAKCEDILSDAERCLQYIMMLANASSDIAFLFGILEQHHSIKHLMGCYREYPLVRLKVKDS